MLFRVVNFIFSAKILLMGTITCGKQNVPGIRGPDQRKKWLLLVEDDPSVQDFFRSILPPEGFYLYIIDNGEEAIRCIEDITFDIIVLDFHLRGDLNGFDILRRCRKKTSARILSNTGSPEHSAKMSLLGADQALFKNAYMIHRALGIDIGDDFLQRRGHVEEALDEMRRNAGEKPSPLRE